MNAKFPIQVPITSNPLPRSCDNGGVFVSSAVGSAVQCRFLAGVGSGRVIGARRDGRGRPSSATG